MLSMNGRKITDQLEGCRRLKKLSAQQEKDESKKKNEDF